MARLAKNWVNVFVSAFITQNAGATTFFSEIFSMNVELNYALTFISY